MHRFKSLHAPLMFLAVAATLLPCLVKAQPSPSKVSAPRHMDKRDIATQVQGLLEKLMSRDGHLEGFHRAKESVAAVCVDWSSVRRRGPATFLSIEHYWLNFDEGSIDSMRADSLEQCSKWKAANSKPCDFASALQNNLNVLHVPYAVNRRLERAGAAYQMASSPAYKHSLERIAEQRRSGTLLSKDSASPYRTIEVVQQAKCNRDAVWSNGCTFKKETCLANMKALSEQFGFTGDK